MKENEIPPQRKEKNFAMRGFTKIDKF